MAFLKGFGKTPFCRDKLTSLVSDRRRMSIHLLTRKVGHGSSKHVFGWNSSMNLKDFTFGDQLKRTEREWLLF